jgi:hypothetical protein
MHRALTHLAAVARQPQALPWAVWPELRAALAAAGLSWPRHCYLPHGHVARWAAEQGLPMEHSALAHQIAIQSALAAWRPTQGIYRYDDDVGLALACCPLTGELPAAALRRLPEWSVYIETDPAWQPIAGLPPVHGAWLTIDWHSQDGDELRLVCDHGDSLTISMLPLAEGISIPAALDRQRDLMLHALARDEDVTSGILQGPDRHYQVARLWSGILSLALYLCAEPELYAQRSGATAPPRQRPAPRRTRAGYRDHPPAAPEIWETAYRLGHIIRQGRDLARAHDAEGRHGPRPHIRRAHWHSFWCGPADRRELRPRWLPPIPVATADDEAIVPTIHRVDRQTRPGPPR